MDNFDGATQIGRISHAPSAGQWRFKWTDASGKRRTCCRAEKSDAEKAHRAAKAAARELAAKKPARKKIVTPANLDPASAHRWSIELAWYRDQIRAAVESNQDEDVDLITKAARTVAALGQAQIGHRDMAALEEELREIKKWRDELKRASKLGTTHNDASRDSRSSSGRPRPGEPVH